MTNFHNSIKITSLLNSLPSDVANDVYKKIEDLKDNQVKICIFSNDSNLITDFKKAFFSNPTDCSDRHKQKTKKSYSNENKIECYTSTNIKDMSYSPNKDVGVVFWLVNFNNVNEDEEFSAAVRRSGTNIFTVLNYNSEDYKELKAKKEEGVECPIKTRSNYIKGKIIKKNSIFDVCLSERGDGLKAVAKAFVKSYPSKEEIFALNTVKSSHVSSYVETSAIGNYASFISYEIKNHFSGSSDGKKAEIDNLIKKHIGDEISKGGVASVVNVTGTVVGTVAGAVFSGLGSLFRSLKNK